MGKDCAYRQIGSCLVLSQTETLRDGFILARKEVTRIREELRLFSFFLEC